MTSSKALFHPSVILDCHCQRMTLRTVFVRPLLPSTRIFNLQPTEALGFSCNLMGTASLLSSSPLGSVCRVRITALLIRLIFLPSAEYSREIGRRATGSQPEPKGFEEELSGADRTQIPPKENPGLF